MKRINYRKNKKQIDWFMAISALVVMAVVLAYLHFTNLYMLVLSEQKNNWYILNPNRNLGVNFYSKLVRKASSMGNESRVITMNSFVDSSGKRLRKECIYKLNGSYPNTLWWDVVGYDDTKKLIVSRDRKLSVDSIHSASKDIDATLGGNEEVDNWIAFGGVGMYQIQVRLYFKSSNEMTSFEDIKTPVISKVKCRGEK